MKLFGKFSPENFLVDLVVSVLACRVIDISRFVGKSLPWAIYFIVIFQSVALFFLYADLSVDDPIVEKGNGWKVRLRSTLALGLRGAAMFSWALGFIWVIVPIVYLENQTGQSFVWAKRISVAVGILSGLILLCRFFANGEGNSEREFIAELRNKNVNEKTLGEKIVIPVYAFVLYGIVGTSGVRYRVAYVLTFVFLIYTETLFQLIAPAAATPKILLVPAIIFSYLPIRLLLLLRPPFSLLEAFSAACAFGLFVFSLF